MRLWKSASSKMLAVEAERCGNGKVEELGGLWVLIYKH